MKEETLLGMIHVMRLAETEETFILKDAMMVIVEQGMDVIILLVMFQEDLIVPINIQNLEELKLLKELGGVLTNAMKFAGTVTTLNFTIVMTATLLTETDAT